MHELRQWARGCFVGSLVLVVAGVVLLFFPATRLAGIVLLGLWPVWTLVLFYQTQEKA